MKYRPQFTTFKMSRATQAVRARICLGDRVNCCYCVITNAHGGSLLMGEVFRACF